jgi:hypothetical protein
MRRIQVAFVATVRITSNVAAGIDTIGTCEAFTSASRRRPGLDESRPGGVLDQVGSRARLRDVDRVAGGLLDHRRACPLGHGSLRRRGIMRSSVATRYQLGLMRQAGSVTLPLSASTPHGTCESAMKAASSAGTSAANESTNFPRLSVVDRVDVPLKGNAVPPLIFGRRDAHLLRLVETQRRPQIALASEGQTLRVLARLPIRRSRGRGA